MKIIEFPRNNNMGLKIYQLKMILQETKPEIWRRFKVESNILLNDLHKIIQTVMGWTNSHLHQFVFEGKFYCVSDDVIPLEYHDYSEIALSDLIQSIGQKINYEYDFGDGWDHEIVLEKIEERGPGNDYPVCLEGERCCPPEDSGGPFGYEELCEAVKNPDHEENEELLEWLGTEFDPEKFDLKTVNELLKDKNYGCLEILDDEDFEDDE